MESPRDGVAEIAPAKTEQRRLSLRTFQSLAVPDFRSYLASSLAQMTCMNMQQMANGWFMYQLTGSAALLGLTMLASAVPMLAFSFAGGIIADRLPKKGIVMLGLLLSSLVTLGIGLSIQTGIVTWHYLIASAFFQGTIMSLMMPSRQAIISELVGRKNLMNAIALNMAGMNITQLAAPALAGLIIAVVGISSVYFLMTGLFILAILLLARVRQRVREVPLEAGTGRERNVLADLRDGIGYVRTNSTVLAILALTLLSVMLAVPYILLMPVFAQDVLKVGPAQLGLLMGASGLGALVGSFGIASMANKSRGILYLRAMLVFGGTLFVFSFVSRFNLALAIMIALGLTGAVRMTLSSTLLQSYTEDAYMGRVMSIFMMQWGVTSLGSFFVSIAAEFVGVQVAIRTTAVLVATVALAYYAFSPRIRRLD